MLGELQILEHHIVSDPPVRGPDIFRASLSSISLRSLSSALGTTARGQRALGLGKAGTGLQATRTLPTTCTDTPPGGYITCFLSVRG